MEIEEEEKEEKEEKCKGIGYIDNKYIILQELSFGAQAKVYSVKEINSNNIYAAKISSTDSRNSQSNETRILNYLKNKSTPNIANIIDSGIGKIIIEQKVCKSLNYIILELATKRSLDKYIVEKKGFGEPFGKVIFYKIVKNIQIIHEKGISHRDIKLGNVLLDGDDFDIKITDFGLSIEYSSKLIGNCGTNIYKAPEIDKTYDGFKIDVFSLGVTLLKLTYYQICFEKEPRLSKLYSLLTSKEEEKLEIFWKVLKCVNKIEEEPSDDLKDLFYKMIEPNPKKRITIKQILKHKWFGEIRNMTPEQLKQYEQKIKLKDELKRREIEIIKGEKEEIKMDIEEHDNGNDEVKKKSIEPIPKENAFYKKSGPKYVEKEKYMNYCIYIKGNLIPKDFMYMIYQEIIENWPNCRCQIDDDDDKLRFNVTFYGEGIFEDVKEQLKELGIEIEDKKENEDDDENEEENELIIKIKLYQTKEGYLLRFVKKQGDKYDFNKKFEDIKNLVKEIVNKI